MSDSPEQLDSPSDEFDERLWLEIVSWDLRLFVLMSPSTPVRLRVQGLHYARALVLTCRVVRPRALRGRELEVGVSPFGPELTFGEGDGDVKEVGWVYPDPRDEPGSLRAELMLPADGLDLLATALGTVTRYLLIETFDETVEETARQANVSGFYFSATLPEHLACEVGD